MVYHWRRWKYLLSILVMVASVTCSYPNPNVHKENQVERNSNGGMTLVSLVIDEISINLGGKNTPTSQKVPEPQASSKSWAAVVGAHSNSSNSTIKSDSLKRETNSRPTVSLEKESNARKASREQLTKTMTSSDKSELLRKEREHALANFCGVGLGQLVNFIEYVLQAWDRFDADAIFADMRKIHGNRLDGTIKTLKNKISPLTVDRNKVSLELIAVMRNDEGIMSFLCYYIMDRLKGKKITANKDKEDGKVSHRTFVWLAAFLMSALGEHRVELIRKFLISMFPATIDNTLEKTLNLFFAEKLHNKKEYVFIIESIYREMINGNAKPPHIKKLLETFKNYGWGCVEAYLATVNYIKRISVGKWGIVRLISGLTIHILSFACVKVSVDNTVSCVNKLIYGSDGHTARSMLGDEHVNGILDILSNINLNFIKKGDCDHVRYIFYRLIFMDNEILSKIYERIKKMNVIDSQRLEKLKRGIIDRSRNSIRDFMLKDPNKSKISAYKYSKEYVTVLDTLPCISQKQVFITYVAMLRNIPLDHFIEVCNRIEELYEKEKEEAKKTKESAFKLLFAETNRTFFINLTKVEREKLLILIANKKDMLIFYLLYMLGSEVRQYVLASLLIKKAQNNKFKHPLEDDISELLIPNNPRAGFAFPKIVKKGGKLIIKKAWASEEEKREYFMDRYGDKVSVWIELIQVNEYYRGDNFIKLLHIFSIWELCRLNLEKANNLISILLNHTNIGILFKYKFGFFFSTDMYKKFITLEHIGPDIDRLTPEAQEEHGSKGVFENENGQMGKHDPREVKMKLELPCSSSNTN